MKLTFNEKEFELSNNSTYLSLVQASLGKKDISVVAVKVGENILDLSEEAKDGEVVKPVYAESDEGVEIIRHSAAHIMAEAVKKLYPDVYVTIGPAIKDGFYYDFDAENPFTSEDLADIEKEMNSIIKSRHPFKRSVLSKEEAIALFDKKQEMYKVEIIQGIDAKSVSIYEQGDFVDLCRGPHVPHTGYIKAFALLSVAGAYWRGDEKNKMLSRIYGSAFASKDKLDAYLKRIKEAKERDHRKVGKDLELFSFHEEGPGFPFWHPNGMVVYKELEAYIRNENEKRGYDEVKTPVILNEELWHRSGHWDNFRENMYFTDIDENEYAVKPMNCPGGLMIYKSAIHSYRDLPIRNAELGMVHRHELSGVLHGLFRVRAFTQDDAHIFCMEEQLEKEIVDTIQYTLDVYNLFGFTQTDVFLATRPEKALGEPEVWEMATNALKGALSKCGIDYKIKEGEGAFYGPKIEFNIKDVLERNWQCGTIQVDFSMPARFDITYEGSDGQRHTPVMLHRAIFGSLERFIGILIEHYNGKFPLWLAPLQVAVICVGNSESQLAYADEVGVLLKEEGLRVKVDKRDEKLGYKIRYYRLQRIPYTIIIGDEEVSTKKLSIRLRSGDEFKGVSSDNFVSKLKEEKTKRMNKSIYESGRGE